MSALLALNKSLRRVEEEEGDVWRGTNGPCKKAKKKKLYRGEDLLFFFLSFSVLQHSPVCEFWIAPSKTTSSSATAMAVASASSLEDANRKEEEGKIHASPAWRMRTLTLRMKASVDPKRTSSPSIRTMWMHNRFPSFHFGRHYINQTRQKWKDLSSSGQNFRSSAHFGFFLRWSSTEMVF